MPAVFVCAGEVSGFSVGGGVAPSETGRLLGRGGHRHVDLVVLEVGVGGGRGMCAYGFVRRTFSLFPRRARAALMSLVGWVVIIRAGRSYISVNRNGGVYGQIRPLS